MEPQLTLQPVPTPLIQPTKLELRRATLGVLLHADAPLRVGEIVRRLAVEEGAMLSSSMRYRCVNWRRIRFSEVRGR